MSEDPRPNATRQDLPDELPRSAISGKRLHDPINHRRSAPSVIWLLLGLFVVAGFIALLWMLIPASEGIGRSGAEGGGSGRAADPPPVTRSCRVRRPALLRPSILVTKPRFNGEGPFHPEGKG